MKGNVFLSNSAPVKCSGVNLLFYGDECVKYWYNAPGIAMVRTEGRFYKHEWNFAGGPKGTIPPGDHTWPFELLIPGTIRESIEGGLYSYVVYGLKATLGRSKLHKDLNSYKHIRVIRTYDPAETDLAQTAGGSSNLSDKLVYEVSTPTRGVIFGTVVPVHYKFKLLVKGMEVNRIDTELKEECNLQGELSDHTMRHSVEVKTVVENLYDVPENLPLEDVDGTEGFHFVRELKLPHNLKQCSQTVEGEHIQNYHHIHYLARIKNPDGHFSVVRGSFPIHIFISPDLRIDESSQLLNPSPSFEATLEAGGFPVPPLYGQHQYDQLYEGIDPTQYHLTHSMASTPLDSTSRTTSHEDMANSLSPAQRQVSAGALNSRLVNLDTSPSRNSPYPRPGSLSIFRSPGERSRASLNSSSGTNIAGQRPAVSPSGPSSSSLASNASRSALSRPASNEPPIDADPGLMMTPRRRAAATARPSPPGRLDLSAERLSRVPSYQTALHTPALSANAAGPPSYEAAVSRPSTPPPSARGRDEGRSRSAGRGGRRVHYADGTSEG